METSPAERAGLDAAVARRALSVFFLSGLLMAFLGAILPAWGYHIRGEFVTVGHYFLSLNIGLLASMKACQQWVARKGISFVLVLGSGLAGGSFLWLALASPPAHWGWRMAGLALVGFSTGLLNGSAFHAISSIYRHDRASTVNLAGAFHGLGCLVMTLLVAGTFYVYTVPSILFLVALIPGFYAGYCARFSFPIAPAQPELKWQQALEDLKTPVGALFGILLFFQFGNEWSVAGWLPLFLIQRMGVSPASSLTFLALYWLALLVGRTAAQALLPHLRHSRLLLASVMAALLGCLILMFTDNRFGAGAGILLLGGGFAAIYPLVVEKIGDRFPYYHPGFFNGIFSFAITGGLMAPWTLGYIVPALGIRAVMGLPLAGTFVVFVLVILLSVEARLTGGDVGRRPSS